MKQCANVSSRRSARGSATYLLRVAAVAAISFFARDAAAQSDLANAALEDLMRISVTTATRTEETVANAPARIEVITAEQIRRRGYRHLTDVLEDLVDFRIDLGGDPDYPANLAVQGTRGSNMLIVLLDGVRVSSPTNEPLPILGNYPVHTAQQIEIVYGPASAIYGADAFAGVINIITKKGTEAPGVSVGTSLGQFGLYNQTMSYGRAIGAGGSLMLGGQFLYDRQADLSRVYPEDFRGLEAQRTGVFQTIYGPMTSPLAVSPDFEAPILARSFQASLGIGGLNASVFVNQSQASTTLPYTPDNGVYNDEAFTRNNLAVVSAGYTRPFGRVTSSTTITMSRHEMSPESGYWNVFSNLKRSYKYAYGSMLKGDEQVTWKPSGHVTVTAGGTVERFFAIPQTADLNAKVTSRNHPGTILDTNIIDEFMALRYTNTGAYGQVRYGVSPAVSFTLGARGDYNTRYGGTFNPRAGVILRPAAMTTVKVLYGTAFLAPSPYESFAHYGSFYSTDGGQTYASDYWHLGNADLKPQKKKTVEATLTQGLGRALVVSASGFYSRVTDLRIAADPDRAYSGTYLGWPVAYIDFPINEGDATTYGGTAALEFTMDLGAGDRLRARTALSVADGSIWSDEAVGTNGYAPIGGMVPVQLRSTVDLDLGRWSIAPRLAVVGPQRTMALESLAGRTRRRTLDGYAVVDVNVRRTMTSALDLFVTVDNALDARYRHFNSRAFTNPEELVGAPQGPRRVVVGVDLRLR